jgi:hypothetical protein
MKSLIHEKLLKLRSGHTVWRVWGHANEFGEVHAYASRYVVLGKKVHHVFSKGEGYAHISMKMVCVRPEIGFMDEGWRNRENRVHFLSDMQGLRCYHSQRAAERFVKEVNDGLWPEITQMLVELYADKAFEDWGDPTDGSYENLLEEDMAWNESDGQGA